MKVLLPTMRDPGQIGGTSTHLDMLSAGLAELGHEPYVLYFGDQVPEPLRRFGVVYAAGTLNRVRRGWGMIYSAMVRGKLVARFADRELRRHDWQVVNAQEVYSVPGLRAAADRAGVPLVLTLHGYPLYESVSEGYTNRSRLGRRYLMRSEIRALRLADAIVTVDGRLYRHVLRLVPERADVTYSLMNFIDTSAFSPTVEGRQELRRKWDIAEDKIVLFCPRRLVKKNGVIYPSLALAEMKPAERDKYLLLHAGEGGERGAIEQIVRAQGLEGQVRMLGGRGRQEIEELYRLCDIVLVPSVHSEKVEEATSLSALEAMASGRPLIAGAVGGLAEMVSDGVNGLLVP
ncbi:MAG TPA: glycosyltransferase family 4 protein, partial [Thermoleophilia bacterium]|nr:glycosyltransferase family 4 protein [Thermoleophilia bacterium]